MHIPTLRLPLPPGKKLYIASDFHLGSPTAAASLARERRVVAWLEQVAPHAGHIILLGDVFDFWFEYRRAIPKGFVRMQGALARLTDAGIKVSLYTGNHDMWMFGYLPSELGVEIVRQPTLYEIGGHRYLLGHGDGLGPGDRFYKLLRYFFHSRLCQWLFGILHPDIGLWIAQGWSGSSRNAHGHKDAAFKEEKEHLWQWCNARQQVQPVDYYIFGHRHLRLRLPVEPGAEYINLGDWYGPTAWYAAIDAEGKLEVMSYGDA